MSSFSQILGYIDQRHGAVAPLENLPPFMETFLKEPTNGSTAMEYWRKRAPNFLDSNFFPACLVSSSIASAERANSRASAYYKKCMHAKPETVAAMLFLRSVKKELPSYFESTVLQSVDVCRAGITKNTKTNNGDEEHEELFEFSDDE